jgi:hypothetical protein
MTEKLKKFVRKRKIQKKLKKNFKKVLNTRGLKDAMIDMAKQSKA